ncbi:hypothetical protein EHZ19_15710 [Paraburkholderia bannensis]|nr:hypothetical protein [Paraburkholderia bannensis]RQM47099.1 hypothetical protein EHZ19_15710 [Paraburkholderia bannensis]
MTSTPVDLPARPVEDGLKLNRDLANQLNEMIRGEHASSECWSADRPMFIEGVLWSIFGATLWLLVLYIVT